MAVDLVKRDKFIVNVQAFLPKDNEIKEILDICGFLYDDLDWMIWKDECGNILKINQDKRIDIIYNKNQSLLPYDIYLYSSPSFIVEKSIWASIINCNEDNVYIYFLGKDYKLRLIHYHNNEYKNINPIILGLSSIRSIVKQIKDPQVKFTGKMPKVILKNWVIKDLPLKDDALRKTIEKDNYKLVNKIITEIFV